MKNAPVLPALALTAILCGAAIAAKYDKRGHICCLTKGETYSAPITGMVCKDCGKAIKDSLRGVKGVQEAWRIGPIPTGKGS